jgi:DNA-binding transcriptional MerR regulator
VTDVEPYDPDVAPSLEQRVQDAERRAAAIRLRNTGASIARIAQTLHYDDEAHAARDIEEAIDELIRVPAAELVGRQQALIMDMTRACYRAAAEGDTNSVEAIRRLMDHQAKLFGLYSPAKFRVQADDGQFNEKAAELLADLQVSTAVDVPPTIDADEDWTEI